MEQFATCWEGLEDPRTSNASLHDLHELLFIALCTVLCGGQNAVDMAEFVRAKEVFLRQTLARAPHVPNSPSSYAIYTKLIARVEVIDPLTVRIHTKGPAPTLLADLEGVVIVSKRAAEASWPLTALLATYNAQTGMGQSNRGRWSNAAFDAALADEGASAHNTVGCAGPRPASVANALLDDHLGSVRMSPVETACPPPKS